ncbi:MAG: class I SAM-dependent methyltransferase [Gemmatimonadota bacterium]|nr:MAG: class I SAM-dependent methyltransferase [Gemmatimonadota bacterium]
MTEQRRSHWDNVYSSKSSTQVSWYQPRPELSLQLIKSCNLGPTAGIIDVGGGTSNLVDELLVAGGCNLAVLDISSIAIEHTRYRLKSDSARVEWYTTDVTEFAPPHEYALWHDRAVFHFLTEASDRELYRQAMLRAVSRGGYVVIATFALDGPKRCSGLDAVRYSPESLSSELGQALDLVESRDEIHRTPSGGEQKFVYCRFRRVA